MIDTTMADQPLVLARQVGRVFVSGAKTVQALRDINLVIREGVFVTLAGRSGSGKTTLLNCLGGLDVPDRGAIWIAGRSLAQMSEGERTRMRRQQIGFVFQNPLLHPGLSAGENVEVPLRLVGASTHVRGARVATCLAQVGLESWAHHHPYQLSGGQQQRVAVARALAKEPQLVLADEPTGELDRASGRRILQLLRNCVDQLGVTVVVASHDPQALDFATTILHLRDGCLFTDPAAPH
jgi:putative ABC transport system ATP-binding protein